MDPTFKKAAGTRSSTAVLAGRVGDMPRKKTRGTTVTGIARELAYHPALANFGAWKRPPGQFPEGVKVKGH